MNTKYLRIMSATVLAVVAVPMLAQEPVLDPATLKVITPSKKLMSNLQMFKQSASTTSVVPALPLWRYQVVAAQDGNTYTGAVVGGNPFNRGARTTNVNVVLIPLRVVLTGTVRTFDPTSPDSSCLSNTALTLTQQSPLFNPVANYTMNGVNLGTVTYPDAFQRGQFWQQVSTVSPAYHTAFNVTVKPVQTITTPNSSAGNGASYGFTGDCGTNATNVDNPPRDAFLDINWVDVQLNTIITNLSLTANQFPLFVTYRTYMTDGPPGNLSNNCCILGYHSTVTNVVDPAQPGQTYGIAGYDNNFLFKGVKDMSTLAHEFMEWVNDPSTINPTPMWGNIGQVGGCKVSPFTDGQNNFEVGDPLSGNLDPAIVMGNGVTYHPQEQAFYSWFYGGSSFGAGGKYSSNGTFTGFAKLCSAGGGTN